MPRTTDVEQGDDHVETNDSSTLRTSQSDQARGYLESLTDNDIVDELQSALTHAQRLTNQAWKVVITADDIEIRAQEDDKRIKIPKPKQIDN